MARHRRCWWQGCQRWCSQLAGQPLRLWAPQILSRLHNCQQSRFPPTLSPAFSRKILKTTAIAEFNHGDKTQHLNVNPDLSAWEESWHVVLKLWTIKRLGLTPRSVCLWERAWGSEGKLWLAAQANQSKLQSIWEICLTAKQACLVNLKLYYSSSTDYWTIKVGFASTVQLKDAQGLKGNAIRSEKNLIFCKMPRCKMWRV